MSGAYQMRAGHERSIAQNKYEIGAHSAVWAITYPAGSPLDGERRSTDRIGPHHSESQRSTFNCFAGLGTLTVPETRESEGRFRWGLSRSLFNLAECGGSQSYLPFTSARG